MMEAKKMTQTIGKEELKRMVANYESVILRRGENLEDIASGRLYYDGDEGTGDCFLCGIGTGTFSVPPLKWTPEYRNVPIRDNDVIEHTVIETDRVRNISVECKNLYIVKL
jgi:hypothetical protein